MKLQFIEKLHEWNTCYHYHTEISELKEGFNTIKSRGKGINGQCNCDCIEVCHLVKVSTSRLIECQAHLSLFQRLTSLCSAILCPKDGFAMFHQHDCKFSQCENYGVEKLKVCPYKQNLDLGLCLGVKLVMLWGKPMMVETKRCLGLSTMKQHQGR